MTHANNGQRGRTADVEISVIIPVYRCEPCLATLHALLCESLDSLDVEYEIVLVDDESPDNAWETILQLAEVDRKVVGYRLSRNFGQHAAITAGLEKCRGQWAIVMDGDLEDSPQDAVRLYQTARQGYDIVLARRKAVCHSWFRRVASKSYFRLLSILSRQQVDGDFGNFSIISRKVIQALLQVGDVDRQYLLLLRWIGFRSTEITYDRGTRQAGQSSYNLTKLIALAFHGVLFQTTVLLHWIVYVGFGLSMVGSVLALVHLVRYFAYDIAPGWTTLALLQLVLGGFIIFSTGVTGMYIGKIFQQVKGRPLYVVAESVGPDRKDNHTKVPSRPGTVVDRTQGMEAGARS